MGLRRIIKNRFGKHTDAKKEIINVYHTSHSRHVLISYIVYPFQSANQFTHQNYITAHIAAECFSALGYNVDVVDYMDQNLVIDYGKYSVIFGLGYNFEQSFYHPDRSIPRIHFVTGAHEDLHNKMSLTSMEDFYQLSGLWLANEANVMKNICYYSNFSADLDIIFAHGLVLNDYRSRVKNPVCSLNNNVLNAFEGFKPKSKEGRTSNFLFLSGAKLITKGLFILLEVARLRQDLNFYIVVQQMDETFERYYQDLLLKEGTNVRLYKNLRMDSEEMKEIVEACTYSVAPSYIDGLPGGTIEPMAGGLIPIVSKYCGLPEEKFIFEMESLAPEVLNETINQVLALDDDTYMEYSNAVKEYTRANFSGDHMKKELMSILTSELSGVLNYRK